VQATGIKGRAQNIVSFRSMRIAALNSLSKSLDLETISKS
jgi:hypothetical protein